MSSPLRPSEAAWAQFAMAASVEVAEPGSSQSPSCIPGLFGGKFDRPFGFRGEVGTYGAKVFQGWGGDRRAARAVTSAIPDLSTERKEGGSVSSPVILQVCQ